MRYLPIEEPILKDLETRFGYRRAILPAGNFLGLDADTPCVDFADWLLFTRDDVSEDLIYRMTKIIVEDRHKVFEFHFRGIPEEACNLSCPIDPRELCKNIGGIPLHQGAERYYREHGYL